MSTLICTIELDKTMDQGILVQIKEKDGDLTHSIQLNNTGITSISTDGSNTTKITQKPDSIELDVEDGPSNIKMEKDKINIHCKKFILEADEGIEIKAKQGITIESKQDTKIDSKQGIELTSALDTKITAKVNLALKATAKADFEGNLTTVKGSLTNVKGDLVKLG